MQLKLSNIIFIIFHLSLICYFFRETKENILILKLKFDGQLQIFGYLCNM